MNLATDEADYHLPPFPLTHPGVALVQGLSLLLPQALLVLGLVAWLERSHALGRTITLAF